MRAKVDDAWRNFVMWEHRAQLHRQIARESIAKAFEAKAAWAEEWEAYKERLEAATPVRKWPQMMTDPHIFCKR